MDYLAIGVHELASMSERRVERLVNPGKCHEIIRKFVCYDIEIFFVENSNHSIINTSLLAYSELPAFLVQDGGLNSGFMIAHCTAAALGNLVISEL